MQDTPTCRPEIVKEIAQVSCDWGRRPRRYCAGLRSGPAFPVRNSMNNPESAAAVRLAPEGDKQKEPKVGPRSGKWDNGDVESHALCLLTEKRVPLYNDKHNGKRWRV
jgi:hypothetical protein